jgi:two-component system, cell cycle response regulator
MGNLTEDGRIALTERRASAPPESCSVLVVDDSPVARKLVEYALPVGEYSVLLAKTGKEALDLFQKHRPALVITDCLMPDFSGIEVCQRIRADAGSSYTYIILLTGVSDKSEVVRGLKAGADDYLTKPFDSEELLARAGVGRRTVELHREIERKNRQLEQLALTDGLTGLPNRRAIEDWANRQFSGALRHGFPFWVVMTDLDNFKSVNDTCGHSAGDTVLKRFAEILKENIRQCDMCARTGGEEFLIVQTHVEQSGVVHVAERIRKLFECHPFKFGNNEMRVTASFGIASLMRSVDGTLEQLVARADAAMYSAKRHGRNKLEIALADEL